MSHPEQLGFFTAVAAANSALIRDGRVIEIGSYDVNGSVRKIFKGSAEYIGVDLDAGPGVNVVSYGHEVAYGDGTFDVAISGECFEHDLHWTETFGNMCRMTRPGGVVAFTCASTGRPEHGTRRTDLEESPGTQAQGLDYYRNLTEAHFEAQLTLSTLFDSYRFWYLATSCDLYFAGVRAGGSGEPAAQLPDDSSVRALRSIMSIPHRIVRLPLRAMGRLLPEERYQAWALPYWRALLAVQDRLGGGRFRRAEHR